MHFLFSWFIFFFPISNHQMFQFQFVNSFLALFYTAFYLQDIEKLKEVYFGGKYCVFFTNIFSCWQLS